MNKISKLVSLICSICFFPMKAISNASSILVEENSEPTSDICATNLDSKCLSCKQNRNFSNSSFGFKNNRLKNSNSVTIKINCAGSTCKCPIKVIDVEGVPTLTWGDYIDPCIPCIDPSEAGKLKYKDMSLFSPEISFNNNVGVSINAVNTPLKGFQKNDFFFGIKQDNFGNKVLKILSPGVGADMKFAESMRKYIIGPLNGVQFSVKNTAFRLKDLLMTYIVDAQSKGYNVNFELKGHSRGAISLAYGLSLILSELNEPSWKNKLTNTKISLNCVLFDPVSGPDVSIPPVSFISENPSVSSKVTQVISIDTGKPNKALQWAFSSSAFVPTTKNDSTIVLVPFGHGVGLYNMSLDSNGKAHKTMWKYNGNLIKSGKIGHLKPGVYYSVSPFYVEDPNSNSEEEGIKLSFKDRIAARDANRIIPPVELSKLERTDPLSLNLMKESLLMTPNWVDNCNRKNKILEILTKSLRINHILDNDTILDFDDEYSLVLKNESDG